MTGFFGKIFGKKKETNDGPLGLLGDTLQGLIESGNFDISFEMEFNEADSRIKVDLYGEDEELLKAREGQLLESIQLFLKRVLQHRLPEEKIYLDLDCAGFREECNQALVDLADKLREIALNKNKSVYFRALAPRDRKVVHQYLSDDGRIKSRSVGDGHFKKIKIFPIKNSSKNGQDRSAEQPSA